VKKLLYRYKRTYKGTDFSSTKMKKILIHERGQKCNICERNGPLEIENIIPISVGGDLTAYSNLRLVCPRCHKKKSGKDAIILNVMKNLRVIDKVLPCQWDSTLPINIIQKLYSDLLYIYDTSSETREAEEWNSE